MNIVARRLDVWAAALMLWLASGTATAVPALKPFVSGSAQQIVAARAGKAFVIAFWSLSCGYCREELAMFGRLQQKYPGLDLVLVSTDAPAQTPQVAALLQRYALGRADVWMVGAGQTERMLAQIDPEWRGELPRTYFHGAREGVLAVSGRPDPAAVEQWISRQLPKR